MYGSHRAKTLGILLSAMIPVVAGAQAVRSGRSASAGRLAVTLAPPPPVAPVHRGTQFGGHRGDRTPAFSRWGLRSAFPLVVGVPYQSSAPATVYVPYPVPYYYPVPARYTPDSTSREPRPAPPPYNPELSKTIIVGTGHDGGGGVMRVARLTSDSIRITWFGTARPIREAQLFLADSAHRPLRTRAVGKDHAEARFSLAGLEGRVGYTGLTVVFGDGSTRTHLVPLARVIDK